MDGYLKKNLEMAKGVIKKDWDMVFIVDGAEGSGKSVMAQQAAYCVDSTFNIDRIVFTPYAFRKAILASKRYQAIVYDEAYTGLSSRATMSLINRTLVSMLAEIRQKNLFVFVILPSFFDLDKYVALWRSRALIHIYTGQNFQRGFFTFYNAEKKKILYIEGKKYYSYNKPKANFYGRFSNHYVIDEQLYRKLKKEALVKREKGAEEQHIKQQVQDDLFNRLMESEVDMTHEKKIALLAIPKATYYWKLKRWREKEEFK